MNRLGKLLPRPAQDRIHRWRVAARDRLQFGRAADIRDAAPSRFVRTAYQILLRRNPDPGGLANYVGHLRAGRLTPDGVLDELLTSMEVREVPYRNLLRSMHQSRCDFVRLLPRAERILDLGGTDQDDDFGALVTMGYPYPFEQLVIIDLPHDERHELYGYRAASDVISSPIGPVQYRYHSMTDLSGYAADSFDLVFSGQTIEHITEHEAQAMLAEVHRVLRSGGWFCLDTPNVRATELMLGPGKLSNPDHKLEYTHERLVTLLRSAGFDVVGEFGLNHLGDLFEKGEFDDAVAAQRHGVYADGPNCQLLAYTCRTR